jgi:hypothetical protein
MTLAIAQPVPARESRIAAAMLFAASLTVLSLAVYLDASPTGVGTHRQLGLPPCGMYATTGVPCATCGMTTAFSHAAHGRLIDAFTTQPAGALLAMATAMALLISVWALVTGMSLTPLASIVWRPRTVFAGAAVVIVAWIYKIMVVTGWF